MRVSALTLALLGGAAIGSQAIAEDALWSPEDYEGAWVRLVDNAKNGCWTNLGESKEYAEDQMELVGFEIIEEPEGESGKPSPIVTDNYAVLVLEVSARRWNDGTCVGHVTTYFLGPVVHPNRRQFIAVNPVGLPDSWTIWDDRNLNNYVLDHLRNYVPRWVDRGKIDDPDE